MKKLVFVFLFLLIITRPIIISNEAIIKQSYTTHITKEQIIKFNNSKPKTELNYRIVKMEVTAYTLKECGKNPTDKGYGITASGVPVRQYRTVAASRSIPFGTRMRIPEFERFVGRKNIVFVVEDRGGAITANKLDVYVSDVEMAKQWGRRVVDVIIFK